MMRSILLGASLLACGCVEPSQARVTETPEQLLDDDCASYKPVKGVMPGTPPPKSAADGAAQPVAEARCTGTPAK